MRFPLDEYQDRWDRVYEAIRSRGAERAILWQRSGGSYDRCGDVFWLSNYASLASGQEPARLTRPGRAFAALFFDGGEEPELHIAEPIEAVDLDEIATERVYGYSSLIEGLTSSLNDSGVKGPVLYVGDDTLPTLYARELFESTPAIEWIPADDVLDSVTRIKSARELDVYREAGEVATRGMTALMEALISAEPESEAAARAATECLRAGGGFHRIGINHGPKSQHFMWSSTFYGFTNSAPDPGDIVRAWLYGPILDGYWLDPARTAVAGNAPAREQRELIESCASIVEGMIDAVHPGATALEIGAIGDRLSEKAGISKHKQEAFMWGYGHGVGTYFQGPKIAGKGRLDTPEGFADEVIQAGMVLGVEASLTHEGVGTAGFEQNVIVVSSGSELLTKTPMVFW